GRRYLNQLLAEGRSRYTVRGARSALKELTAFLGRIGLGEVGQLDGAELLRYREELAWRLTPKGTPLSVRSQLELLGHVANFCRFLVAQGWLLADPSEKLPRPRKPQRLPRSIIETGEVERILALPDTRTPRGYRDRVILEILYSTALRREEIAKLLLDDVDPETGYVFVREGKGSKDRSMPRPQRFKKRCRGMEPNAVWCVVRKYAKRAGVEKPVSTHSFRHACATHMLRNGAPIRQLQEMLGHASLTTTQLYTRVTINDLRAMHSRFHPREQGELKA
ncbi:MAG TPA: tyrosine-type recombinase/integrase, partial [Burkholderiales bacterium]|nr:tyrosine-type recombinase/integrase [Burkholderiales bacterium]